MSEIFISYKREDQASARKLANALESQGWSVWWDPKLRAGERFNDVIEKALKESKAVIVMWSKRSAESVYVKDEATYALNRNKIVPVMIEKVELPFRFEGLHTPSLSDWDGSCDAPGFRMLVDDITTILGRGRAAQPDAKERLRQKKRERPVKEIKPKTHEQVNERRALIGQTSLKPNGENQGSQTSDTPPKPVFVLPIEDIFHIAGRGAVVTGVVTTGTCQVGQEVAILKNGVQVRRCVVSGIEQFRKLIDMAKTGDHVGILLRGEAKEGLEPGMVVVGPV
jgi:hypothetical protein